MKSIIAILAIFLFSTITPTMATSPTNYMLCMTRCYDVHRWCQTSAPDNNGQSVNSRHDIRLNVQRMPGASCIFVVVKVNVGLITDQQLEIPVRKPLSRW